MRLSDLISLVAKVKYLHREIFLFYNDHICEKNSIIKRSIILF